MAGIVSLPSQGRLQPKRIDLPAFTPSSSPGTVLAYLGVPFAQPPTLTNRWKVPQGPLPSWSDLRTSQWGNDPHQPFDAMQGFYYSRRDHKRRIKRDEDCFYLNVWVPQSTSASSHPLPVMVWIYGGAFAVGNTSRPMYDGARLALEANAIIVSLPYRVGALGFLGSRQMALQALGDYPLISREAFEAFASPPSPEQQSSAASANTSGNWALWDLVAGLLWVQHSISVFGGDSNNVTVFGESAGSVAIHYLLLSPSVPSDLFHKAILQSGVALTIPPKTTAASQATYDYLVHTLVPSSITDPAAQLHYLQTRVSADAIHAAMQACLGTRPRSEYIADASDKRLRPQRREDLRPGTHSLPVQDKWGPVWDGVMVPRDFFARNKAPFRACDLRNGARGIVVGYVVDEGSMFNMLVRTPSALAAHLSNFTDRIATDVARTYGTHGVREREAFVACATYSGDSMFHGPITDVLRANAGPAPAPGDGSGVPVYGYVFAHRPSGTHMEGVSFLPGLGDDLGVFHTADVFYVFGFDAGLGHTWDGEPPSLEGGTMTPAERGLSARVMRAWAAVAHDRPGTWTRLDAAIPLLAFGDAPQLGVAAPDPVPDRGDTEIKVHTAPLAEHAHARTSPVPASYETRLAFWTHPINDAGVTRNLLMYYGYHDALPTWNGWGRHT